MSLREKKRACEREGRKREIQELTISLPSFFLSQCCFGRFGWADIVTFPSEFTFLLGFEGWTPMGGQKRGREERRHRFEGRGGGKDESSPFSLRFLQPKAHLELGVDSRETPGIGWGDFAGISSQRAGTWKERDETNERSLTSFFPSYAYLEGKAFRHGDIEDILESMVKKAGGGFLGLVRSLFSAEEEEPELKLTLPSFLFSPSSLPRRLSFLASCVASWSSGFSGIWRQVLRSRYQGEISAILRVW